LYVPAHNEEIVAVDCPLDQVYVYGEVPPETTDDADPVQTPLQDRSDDVRDNEREDGSEIV
jgi:hypothetical protein